MCGQVKYVFYVFLCLSVADRARLFSHLLHHSKGAYRLFEIKSAMTLSEEVLILEFSSHQFLLIVGPRNI